VGRGSLSCVQRRARPYAFVLLRRFRVFVLERTLARQMSAIHGPLKRCVSENSSALPGFTGNG
jgi:hypothetical protein